MEWSVLLLIFFGGLVILMAMGLPVAFSFFVINAVTMYFFWGGLAGLEQLMEALFVSVASFTLLPFLLFILMGELMVRSGLAPRMLVGTPSRSFKPNCSRRGHHICHAEWF
jgi:TRAP-type mannitol/chloroaromatic compound transport system permease large subunit